MNVRTLAIAACAALATTFPAAAATSRSDGNLPLYPGAKVNAGITGMPAAAIAHGVPLVLDTNDSVLVVDRWYRSHARGCKRLSFGGGVKYQCAGGSIMIYRKADTQIALVPAF